jgi:ATP/maltotriose-dependent transcriptional regulator MalT
MYALGQTLYRYGRAADAAESFRRGATIFREYDRELGLMFDGALMCCAMQLIPIRESEMRRLASLVSEIPADRSPTAAERTLLAVRCCNLALGVPPASNAVDLAHVALGDGALLREQTSESMAVNLAIIALIISGRAREAQPYADEVVADARKRGAALAFAEASMVRAMVMLARGRINDAMADAQTAIEGIERGWQALVPVPQAILARCLVERGEFDAADDVLRDVEPLLPAEDARGLNAQYFGARGSLRLARGEAQEALADLLACGETLRTYGYVNPATVPWRAPAALAAHAVGDAEQAARLIDEEIALSREFGLDAQLGAGLRVQAILHGHEISILEQAIELLESADAPLELARALVDLGGALRRGGRRVDCREPLRRAQDLAHQCGATMLEQRARDELLSSGARPRRAMISGIEALTPSERRIADLVAQGHTNRAVAETLFLTKGTVEWHLKHIYQKLDVRGREELKDALAE